MASAGASLIRMLSSPARNRLLNSTIALSSADTMSSSQLFAAIEASVSLREWRRNWRNSVSKRRTSETGMSSILPSVPIQTDTTCSSTGYGE